MSFAADRDPHRRRNLLTGDWVLVSPQRARRPWQGAAETAATDHRASYDPECYLCPGNLRAGGIRNPDYSGAYVFPNDFAALLPGTPAPTTADPLRPIAPARGEARVICFSPDHARTLPELAEAERRVVVETWCDLSTELGARWAHVQIFENKGAAMGCSSPHPHGQAWASDFVPQAVAGEDRRQADWLAAHGRPLLAMVAEAEAEDGARLIEANDEWLAIVPWWAAWPFETLILPRRPAPRLEALDPAQRAGLASLLGALTARYDRLFATSFPYTMGWHGAPHALGNDITHWRLHGHVYPPLLRSASIRKFMVGFEMLAEAQRDLTPEQAAERLRAA